jgi:hypothetical protein
MALLHSWLSSRRCTIAIRPIPGLGSPSRCTGMALLEPLLDIASCLEPVVFLQDLIQGSVDSSDLLTVQLVVRSARPSLCSEGELFGICEISHWWIPCCALERRSSQRGISTGPSTFLHGPMVGDVFPFWALFGLYFLQNGT